MVEHPNLRENSIGILEKDIALRRLSLRLTLSDMGGIYTVYHFVGSNNLRVEISFKKRKQQKRMR